MTDDAERIGGIEVEAGVSQAGLDQDLAAIEAKLKSAAQRWQGIVTVNAGVGMAAGPGAAAPAQRAAPQSAAVSFQRRGAASPAEMSSLERAIADALAKEEAAMGNVADTISTSRAESQTKIAQAVQGQQAPGGAQGIVIPIDTTEFMEGLVGLTAELRAWREQAEQIATVQPRVGGGGGGARRGMTADQRRELKELSYEAERASQEAALASSTFAPPLTEQRRRQRDQARAQARNQPIDRAFAQQEGRRLAEERRAAEAEMGRILANEERGQQAGRGTGEGRIIGGRRSTALDPEIQEAIIQARIARTEAGIVAGGRTGRVAASGIGALFFGTRRQEIEATNRLSAAERELVAINRAAGPILEKRRALEEDVALGRRNAADELREFTQNDDVRDVIEQQEHAQRRYNDALESTQKLQGGANVVRNLAAITIGTTAFGAAIGAVAFGLHALVPALQNVADATGGYGATSTRVTSALAQQTLAQRGNADAVIAQEAATAGLSAEAADYLSTQLKLTTQVKAGALAQAQASDLFRASIGRNIAPSGLLGGFGGLLGGPLFAQQLGGGKGFAEQVAGDFGAFQTATTQQLVGPLPRRGTIVNGQRVDNIRPQLPSTPEQQAEIARLARERAQYEDDLNKAAQRGAEALGLSANAAFRFGEITDAQAKEIAASNLPDELKRLADQSREALFDAQGNLVTTFKQATEGLQQFAVGRGIPDVATLGRLSLAQEQQRQREARAAIPALRAQFEFERPAFIAGAEREAQFARNVQLPAQAALQATAFPALPVGTGLAAANADEAERIRDATKETGELQEQLNDYYAQGRQILIDTFQVPPQLLSAITATGRQIASIQANIRNEQAAFQVAQYNYQLQIAKRTLADIGGLTGRNFGEGQSYLGVLERQNLALSRQAQLLQFAMQQRQINFQVALAGFQAPGVTPEERQARVKEAQIEADFAQKQLNIQREMFGNQVEIVDIQNLRQGADLAAQIGLLLQGRALTIDTAAAEERLLRLQQIQQQQVAEAGTYIEKVNKLTGRAFSEIQNLETAAGTAMYNAATYAADVFGVYLTGVYQSLQQFANSLNPTQSSSGFRGDPGYAPRNASGYVGLTTGATMTGAGWMGEAGQEAYAILRNPQQLLLGDGGGGGGNTVNFYGDMYVRDESDVEKVAIAVSRVINRDAALRGLRTTS